MMTVQGQRLAWTEEDEASVAHGEVERGERYGFRQVACHERTDTSYTLENDMIQSVATDDVDGDPGRLDR